MGSSPRSRSCLVIVITKSPALAALSAVGGFLAVPRFLQPMLPLPSIPEALERLETPLLLGSVAIALAGLGLAAFVYRGGLGRGERLARSLAPVHRVLWNKYYVDELYAAIIVRPLHLVSDRVFLRVGDRLLIDGALHGLARLARLCAAGFSRVQTGSVQLYALLVLLGGAFVLALRWLHG